MVVPTRAPAILVGNLIPFTVASVFMCARLVARAGILKHVALDDTLLLLGWSAAFVNCTLACLGTKYGEGRHEADIAPTDIVPALKLNYATLICYQASLCLTKLGICIFYLRVFSTTRSTRYHVYAIIGFLLAFTVPLEVVAVLSCVPPSKSWSPNPSARGYCLNTIIAFWTSFACNLFSDIWIIVFAVPRVWSLKMQTRQKVALLGTLTLGWVVVAAAIIRVIRISSILHSKDVTWRSYDSSIWSAVEVNVSLICACAPALKPLFKRFAPGLILSLSGRTSQGKPGASGRSTWVKASEKGNGNFEMSRSVTHRDLTSHSQEELANSTGRNHWMTGRLDMDDMEDEVESEGCPEASVDGILKSTQVTVRHSAVHGNGSM